MMRTYVVEVALKNKGDAVIKRTREVICEHSIDAIISALSGLPPFDSASVFCKALPTNNVTNS